MEKRIHLSLRQTPIPQDVDRAAFVGIIVYLIFRVRKDEEGFGVFSFFYTRPCGGFPGPGRPYFYYIWNVQGPVKGSPFPDLSLIFFREAGADGEGPLATSCK